MPSASSTRPRAMRSSQVSRPMAGKCAHRQSSTVAHGPAGRCRVLARCCAAEKVGADMLAMLAGKARIRPQRGRIVKGEGMECAERGCRDPGVGPEPA
ncbi:hypothetical protein D9M71_788470 [compost metagenome]